MKMAFFTDPSYSGGRNVEWGGNGPHVRGQNSHPDHAVSEAQMKAAAVGKSTRSISDTAGRAGDVRQPPSTEVQREKVKKLMTAGRCFPLFLKLCS